jgi:RNA ligase
MNYKFPIIRTIDDVLPHIEGREEFIVAEREGYTVINYMVAMADTFDMTGPDDLTGAMRRECRGLIFDRDGVLMSRPFHKFFNVNERAETQTHEIDMSQSHVIMEKMDGSMIRPILVDGYLRLATKMGVTEVAMDAEAWLAAQDPSLNDWLRFYMNEGYTPIFEWVSPFNQIVLAYEEADLVLLAIRENVTGRYLDLDEEMTEIRCPFTVVRRYGSMDGNIVDYIDRQRGKEGREGDIIRFSDGHMLKVKNDWYVRIHKTIDRVKFDRNIVDLIINENVDDVIPMLPHEQVARIRDFETRFWRAFKQKENRLYGLRIAASQSYEDDRKRIALEFVPTLQNKADASFIFRMLDGHDLRDLILEHVRKNITTNVKWDECAKWFEM